MFRTHFYGQEISRYGRENGFVDYGALARSFDAVLCNGILGYREAWEDWEQVRGFVDNSEAIEEAKAELEEVEERLTETKEAKAKAERDFDDLSEASENIEELLEQFDSFEYEASELTEKLHWNNYETPNGDDIESDDIEGEIDRIDFWSMREAIENHQSVIEEQKTEAEEAFEALEEEVKELTKLKERLEAELDDLECEDTTEAEYYQYFIVSDSGAQILEENTNEALWYNAELDLYVWGVGHFGTAWDYVLTSIPCETYEQEAERLEQEAKEEEERKARAEAMTEEERAEKEAEELEELLDLWDDGFATVGEPTEIEEEPTEDPLEAENGNTLQAWIEEGLREFDERHKTAKEQWEAIKAEVEAEEEQEAIEADIERLEPMEWKRAMRGDIVKVNTATNPYYNTTGDWMGRITAFGQFENDEPKTFEAMTVYGGTATEYGEIFTDLKPMYFDLFNGEEFKAFDRLEEEESEEGGER